MEQGRAIQTLVYATLVCATLVYAPLAFSAGDIVLSEPLQPLPPVKVDVFAQHSGGKISYHYRVFNNSQQDIAAVSIGLDTQNDENPNNDIYELFELPSGWNVKFGIPS